MQKIHLCDLCVKRSGLFGAILLTKKEKLTCAG